MKNVITEYDEHVAKLEQKIKELEWCLSHVMKVATFKFDGEKDYLDIARIKQALKATQSA